MSTFKPQYKDKNGVVRDLNIDYNSLANKPTIGQGTLTIQKNGSNVATFGANSTSNVTANISVPTSLGDLGGSLETTKLYEPTIVNGVTLTSQGIIDITSADRLAFLPADQIIIEKSTDGGATWVSAGFNDTQKRTIFGGLENGGIYIPLNSSGVKSCSCMLRVTITGMKYNVPAGTAETAKYNYWNSSYVKSTERYFNPNLCTLWLSSNSDRIQTTIQMSTGANPNNWSTNVVANGCSGWSGRITIKLGGYVFGGGTGQTSNYWNYRFIFRTQANDGSFDDSKLSTSYTGTAQVIHGIRLYSSSAWNTPSNMSRNGHIYTWDIDQNATFPASVKAPSFYEGGTALSSKYLGISAKAADSNKLNGQSASYYATATSVSSVSEDIEGLRRELDDGSFIVRGANGDGDGNTISTTYATKDEVAKYLPLSGGTLTGNLTLYAASGDSPRLTFQRGTLSDTLNDWSLYGSSGYLHIQQRGSGSTAWETRATFNQSGVNFVGTIQENGTSLANKYIAKSLTSAKGDMIYASAANTPTRLGIGSNGQFLSITDGVPKWVNNPNTDTKNTAGSTNSTSKLFLVGATSQASNPQTYSNSKCYVGTDNCLYSNNTKVLTSHAYRPIQMNGSSILTSGSSTALNLKAGTNISLSNSNGTVTISSTASGGGMTSSLIFAGAGDTSGYYTQTLSDGGYKMLLFEVNVSDFDFYLSVPTDYIKTGSKTLYLAAGNGYNGAMGIVEITASNTNFSASVNSGNIIIYNANVYAYK